MVDTQGASSAQGGAIVAVSDARNALPTPDLAGVSQVETQTHKIGLIYPPPDIRAIVDKTAQFVAKNGIVASTITDQFSRYHESLSAQSCQGLIRKIMLAGREFEKRILANEINNSKFNFLKAGDPYNAYYEHKVRWENSTRERLCIKTSAACEPHLLVEKYSENVL